MRSILLCAAVSLVACNFGAEPCRNTATTTITGGKDPLPQVTTCPNGYETGTVGWRIEEGPWGGMELHLTGAERGRSELNCSQPNEGIAILIKNNKGLQDDFTLVSGEEQCHLVIGKPRDAEGKQRFQVEGTATLGRQNYDTVENDLELVEVAFTLDTFVVVHDDSPYDGY